MYDKTELFLPVINNIRKSVSPQLSQAIYGLECFGYLWRDENGICPEDACVLRTQCKKVYETVQSQIEKQQLLARVKRSTSVEVQECVETSKKHVRTGYYHQGRHVDFLVHKLVSTLGDPPTLPQNWSYKNFLMKYKHLGRLVMAPTASYHVFIVDGNIICRFWTNAAKAALVDLSSLLVSVAQHAGYHTMEVPEHSIVKLKPCVGRIYCEEVSQAEVLAKWIVDAYKIGSDNETKINDPL